MLKKNLSNIIEYKEKELKSLQKIENSFEIIETENCDINTNDQNKNYATFN
jgi:hypothetical protein